MAQTEVAYLAGGCFWGMEELLRQVPEVIETEVGYMGGGLKNATYVEVKTGSTNHAETVKVVFNPSQLKYEDLLLKFFKIHDPTTLNQQGNDRGTQYRSAIFYTSEAQKVIAEQIKKRVDQSKAWGNPVVTQITKAGEFWKAEEYHQDYLQKNANGYTCHFERKISFAPPVDLPEEIKISLGESRTLKSGLKIEFLKEDFSVSQPFAGEPISSPATGLTTFKFKVTFGAENAVIFLSHSYGGWVTRESDEFAGFKIELTQHAYEAGKVAVTLKIR